MTVYSFDVLAGYLVPYYAINQSSGAAPTITQSPKSALQSVTMAFKETAGGAATGVNKKRKLEKMDSI
jgi:hypothetical protein